MCIQLIPVMNIGDFIALITVILYCYFTYKALKQSSNQLNILIKNVEKKRVEELLDEVIFPIISDLDAKIFTIKLGKYTYRESFRMIEDMYIDKPIFIEFKDRFPEILKDIKELDLICSNTYKHSEELHEIIFEEIRDESIKKIKEFNEKSEVKIFVSYSEEDILHEISETFYKYIMGGKPHTSSRKLFWNVHGEQISEAWKKGKKIELSIDEDIIKIREIIDKIKPILKEKGDLLMKEYGIAPSEFEIPRF